MHKWEEHFQRTSSGETLTWFCWNKRVLSNQKAKPKGNIIAPSWDENLFMIWKRRIWNAEQRIGDVTKQLWWFVITLFQCTTILKARVAGESESVNVTNRYCYVDASYHCRWEQYISEWKLHGGKRVNNWTRHGDGGVWNLENSVYTWWQGWKYKHKIITRNIFGLRPYNENNFSFKYPWCENAFELMIMFMKFTAVHRMCFRWA